MVKGGLTLTLKENQTTKSCVFAMLLCWSSTVILVQIQMYLLEILVLVLEKLVSCLVCIKRYATSLQGCLQVKDALGEGH